MAFKDYLEPSLHDYISFVEFHSCAFLLNDQAFVGAVFQLQLGDDSPTYNRFVQCLTRKLFGLLDLSAIQLSTASRAISDRSMKITDLYNMVSGEASMPQPRVT